MRKNMKWKRFFITGFACVFFFSAYTSLFSETLLTVWNMPPAADSRQRMIWDEEVKGFEANNPGIKVKGISREYKAQEFVSVMASGKGPDVVRIPVSAIPVMSGYGFLYRLNELSDSWKQKNSMPEIMWNGVKAQGDVYGIPYDSYFTTLFYRKDIFEKAGITKPPDSWAEIISCLLYTSPSPRDRTRSRMPSSA